MPSARRSCSPSWGFQRTTVEEADHRALDQDAHQRGEQEGERQGDGQRPVEQIRRLLTNEFLHHEGGVGAQHHHFAMRHVDDAHDAEGDGKANGSEEEHRAERKPVPGILQDLPEGE